MQLNLTNPRRHWPPKWKPIGWSTLGHEPFTTGGIDIMPTSLGWTRVFLNSGYIATGHTRNTGVYRFVQSNRGSNVGRQQPCYPTSARHKWRIRIGIVQAQLKITLF
jgi:hypothetical protein